MDPFSLALNYIYRSVLFSHVNLFRQNKIIIKWWKKKEKGRWELRENIKDAAEENESNDTGGIKGLEIENGIRLAYVDDVWIPKAWKILFLKPGLLGLASCWCWLLPVADCPSCSALCTSGSELFACIRLCSHAYVSRSSMGFDQNSIKLCRTRRTTRWNEKKNKKKEEKDSRQL